MNNTWIKDLSLLAFAIAILFSIGFSHHPLHVPDEARYSEIPREMITRHDYVTPYLNNVKYFEKPPLLYWVQAAMIKIGGMSEFSLRLPTTIFALLGCLMTYITGRIIFNRRTGILASIVLATNLLYFSMAHLITTDMTLTFFLCTSLFLFLLGTRAPFPSTQRRLYFWSAYACGALGMLTKGFIALAFPGLIIFVWMLLLNDWRLLKTIYLPSGLLILLLIALPWHLWVQHANPEFFYFYVIEQHILRFSTLYAQRYQPDWFFIPILLLGFFPWTVFLPQAIRFHWPTSWKMRHQSKDALFLFIWIAAIFFVFSVSQSKLVPYILPLFPPLALVTAHYFSKQWDRINTFSLYISFFILIIFSIAIGIGLIQATQHNIILDPLLTHYHVWALASILTLGALSVGYIFWKSSFAYAFKTLTFTTTLFLLVFISMVPHADARSIKPLATVLNSLIKPTDEIACLDNYYQDLPFYLQRPVTVVNWTNELTFGMQHQDTTAWMITTETLWNRWDSKKRMFLIMDIDQFAKLPTMRHRKFYPIALTTDYVLFSNQKIQQVKTR